MKAIFDINLTIDGHTKVVQYTETPKDVQKMQGIKVLILESLLDELLYFKDNTEEDIKRALKEWIKTKKEEFKVR